MNLKLSGSDNNSSYMAAISCLKSKALSILLQLCETESVSYLDEVASNTTIQNMAKSVGLEVLALLVKAWNRFKTAPSTSSYEYSRQHIVFGIMVMRKLKFTVLKNDMIASAQQVLAAVITAGASREHEILAEIRDAIFSFIRKMEPRRVMDTMLVSRVRIFYIMSLLARHRSYNQLSKATNPHSGWAILTLSIRSKATINDFLSIADDTAAGATGQLELLSTAIMDGWMAGLGAAQPPTTDALGQLLSEYARLMWFVMVHILISTVILVHKDIAGTLATEAAEDSAQVAKLRSALESVDHKRRKILQQMKNDTEMLNLESGAAPIRSPSTSAEDARLVSLISLDSILKQVKVFHLSPISHLLTFWQMSQMLQLFCHSS
ncbi:hypothetical protein SASPL_152498 [Salvia splendens]|uniref:Nodulin homeobox N-terminal domain-containing protein n=1 Tax=Salvia splendens TaxID=180675 RepID=A0A8X8Z0E7_SALSN|nr:hypothetical protein SASPL_152498 [Salvia splendens]